MCLLNCSIIPFSSFGDNLALDTDKDSMKHISITVSLVYEYKGCTVSAALVSRQAVIIKFHNNSTSE